jgi:hypothetical protein
MKTIADTLDDYRTQLQIAELFRIKYDAKLPLGLGTFSIYSNSCNFHIGLTYVNPDDRQRALAVTGDVFGRGDWVARACYNNDGFDWTKTLDGVTITITKAQVLDSPRTFPVDPLAFPLQLEESCGNVQPTGQYETPLSEDDIPF